MSKRIAFTVLLLALSASAMAQTERAEETVLLMEMIYSEGRWSAKPATVLPCGGPSKPDSISMTRSMYLLRDREGKVLLQRYIQNPRIILVEDPREPMPLLREMKFRLRVPINQRGKRTIALSDVAAFEFYEEPLAQRAPSVAVRFDGELARLAPNFAEQRPPCGVIAPPMEKLPRLTAGPSDALSLDALKGLVEDRGLLMRWALEHDVTPDQLRKLIAQHERQLSRLNLDKHEVEDLLRDYERAYRGRKKK